MRRRHLVNERAAARSSEWAQHFSNASCSTINNFYSFVISVKEIMRNETIIPTFAARMM